MPAAPSLLIVPYRSKTGKLYSQIPTSGAGDFTVTRNTTATRFNSAGLIESVASGIPRLDYYTSGGTAGCPALLVEPAATNFVPSGTTFAASIDLSFTNSSNSPASSISGTLITKITGVTGGVFAQQTCLTSLPSGSTTYTISRFFKYNGTDLTTSLQDNLSTQWGGTSWAQQVVISAASGVTLGSSTACTGSVENYGNGWYRVSARLATGATPSGTTNVQYLMIVAGSVASGSSFLTALPQLEVGSVATSYIPTTAGAASRSADVISVSGAVSGSIGQTEGTIYAEVDLKNSNIGGRTFLSISEGTTSNRVDFGIGNNNSFFIIRVSATESAPTVATVSGTVAAGIYKIAVGYKSGDTRMYINGLPATSQITDTFTFVNALNKCNIASSRNDVSQLNDRIRAAALYTTRLTDAELATLTTP